MLSSCEITKNTCVCRLSNNISKFLLSMGPFTTKEAGRFYVDHKDDALRGALVTQNGQVMWPPPSLPVRCWPIHSQSYETGRDSKTSYEGRLVRGALITQDGQVMWPPHALLVRQHYIPVKLKKIWETSHQAHEGCQVHCGELWSPRTATSCCSRPPCPCSSRGVSLLSSCARVERESETLQRCPSYWLCCRLSMQPAVRAHRFWSSFCAPVHSHISHGSCVRQACLS